MAKVLNFLKKKNVVLEKEYKEIIQIKVAVDKITFDEYAAAVSIFGDQVEVVREYKEIISRKYIYKPLKKPIDKNQFLEVMYALLTRDFDYIFVSRNLCSFPQVGADCIDDIFIYDIVRCPNGIKSIKKLGYLKGKIMRLQGYEDCTSIVNIQKILPNIKCIYESFLVDSNEDTPLYRTLQARKKIKTNKKVVFVVPIFMAVGGVERNTIEIMRALKDKYDFVVITTERHSKSQGSLNYQLRGLCLANYDLREIIEYQDYLAELNTLKNIYQPDVVWLCNNSPWLEEHLLAFRKVFDEQKIVAQDVYDTEYGWIEYYNTDGIKSIDAYIAVNEKIKTTFINKYNLPEEKIKVIYSAIDDAKVRKTIKEKHSRDEVCEMFGLDKSKKHIALIGRMTEQKNPIRYLEMISQVKDKYSDVEFLIVGDGVLSHSVEKYIEDNHLENVVKRIKFVDNTPLLFQGLDMLVLTSVYEGLAIVSIEAMSIGVPILSTDTGDLRLFLDKTHGGIIIDDNRTDEEQFGLLMDNYDEYRNNAKKHGMEILNFFSASNIAKQYVDLFE